MKLKSPMLIFTMALDSTEELNEGRLVLIDTQLGVVGRWIATSGISQYQYSGSWNHAGGGVIPPTYYCDPPLDWYKVSTKAEWRDTKGIEGYMFPITPFAVTTKDGTDRSDFAIHRDANVPGSLACIVLPDEEWNDKNGFLATFEDVCSDFKEVKLAVIYTY